MDLLGVDQGAQAVGHALYRNDVEAVAVAGGVGGMEVRRHGGDGGGIDASVRYRHEGRLPGLADELRVEGTHQRHRLVTPEAPAELGFHRRVQGVDVGGGVRREHGVGALADRVRLVGGEQAERGEEAGMGWHDDALDVDQVGDRRQQQGTGRTEGHQGVIARVDAVLDGDVEDAFGDVVQADVPGIAHAVLERQRRREGFEGTPREVDVELHLAAGEAVDRAVPRAGRRRSWSGAGRRGRSRPDPDRRRRSPGRR